jgi:hypothetical protein
LNPNTAGLDIGADEIYAAVPLDRDPEPVKCFGTFTGELNALAAWLQQCGIEAVAMEATGVYWIPVFQVLEASGLQVCLVNPRYFQNVPGRRTDVSDCQWLQRLHSAGLLRGSFRPPQAVCALRSLTRHRDNLIQMASKHILHMQKSLDQMNVQLHHVLSDITGLSGLAIIDAASVKISAMAFPGWSSLITSCIPEHHYNGVTLKFLLTLGWKIKPYQVVGPSWLDSDLFDVVAKLPSGSSRSEEGVPAVVEGK